MLEDLNPSRLDYPHYASLGYWTPEAVSRGSGCSHDWGEAAGGDHSSEDIYGWSTRLWEP